MSSVKSKNVFLLLFLLIGTGCGVDDNPSSGNDPNKPIPVLISSSSEVMVDHTQGAIITTPDGKTALSISQTALSADTAFKIELYDLPPGFPQLSLVPMYLFTPISVDSLIPGQILKVTFYYDSGQIPFGPDEVNLRLGILDPAGQCWEQIFLDSPPVITGDKVHSISSRVLTQLGVFGITTINGQSCP